MDYFPVIHIIRKEYILHMNKETYYGHVSETGIYISWTHFLEGYKDYADAKNLALHEMAHAISYDTILGEDNAHDRLFKQRLEVFYKKGIDVFKDIRKTPHQLFDAYSCSDFDEFWAVCVEHFFENSETFKANLPDLYHSIAHLLNQDPLQNGIILNPGLAGLAK